ncbi:tyrosine-protein kinase CSK-like [Pecten maximus]|uniref:tyrosine-protein kinase CSK-like n=1 Tax=Pecten maximus TaxID=6579 RepID=UPI00145863AF|nr:tyrosine-protein kinase CSK-like [Pecten maximus]
MKCEEMMAKVNVGNRMEAPPRCPKAIYDVMMLCWQHDPKSRPSFQRLCEYIQKIRKNEYISIGSCANISDDENDRENSDDYDNKHPIWKCNGNYAIEEDSV